MYSFTKNQSFKSVKQFATQAHSALNTASKRLNYFFRKGQKGITESKRRIRLTERAKKKLSISAEGTNKISSRFKSFFISATPFIGLKTRRLRRGKRVINKIFALTRDRSQRKAFSEFASPFFTTGRSKKPLRTRLEQELDVRFTVKRGSASSATGSSLAVKRALLYSTAYAARGSFMNKKQKRHSHKKTNRS
jgi:hypothetical protein